MAQKSESSLQLLDLVEELQLPINPDEASARLGEMTEEEIQSLLPLFEEVSGYHKNLSKQAKKADPTAFSNAEDEAQKEVQELRKDYMKKLGKFQEMYDEKADSLDAQTQTQLASTLSQSEKVFKSVEDFYKGLQEKVARSITPPHL